MKFKVEDERGQIHRVKIVAIGEETLIFNTKF